MAQRLLAHIRADARNNRRILVLSALTSLVFCLCLPINDIYGQGKYMPYKPTAALFLGFALGCALFYGAYTFFKDRSFTARADAVRPAWKRLLCYGIAPVIACAVAAWGLYPGIYSVDSLSQLKQAMGLVRYNDWHPVGHTLFFFAIPYKLTGSIFAVTIAQLGLYTFTWTYLFSNLEAMGLRRRWLLPVNILLAFIPTNLFLSVSMWKDIPFTCVSVIATVLLIRLWRSGGETLGRKTFQWGLGVCLGFMAILRHNGPILVPIILACLFIVYRKRWKQMLIPAGAVLLLFLGVRLVAFGILDAKPNHPSIPYRWFTQIAAGILVQGGEVTPEEKAALEKMMPIDKWKEYYDPYLNDTLMNVPGKNRFELLAEHRGEIVPAAITMALRNPVKALRAELQITELTWRVIPLGPVNVTGYKNRLDEFDMQIDQESALFLALKNALETVRSYKGLQILFARQALYFFLTLCLLGLAFVRRRKAVWLCFLPVLLNVMSMWVSMPAQDYRYVWLTVFAFPLLLLWSFAPKRGAAEASAA